MSLAEHIESMLSMSEQVVNNMLEDLSDEDLMLRPSEKSNHTAWQLGHLISTEVWMIGLIDSGSVIELPEGFAEKHKTETAESDDPADFYSKAEYLDLMSRQREKTRALLAKQSDEQLMAENPDENLRGFLPTVGMMFSMGEGHYMMHLGQWAVVRRQLGKPPLF